MDMPEGLENDEGVDKITINIYIRIRISISLPAPHILQIYINTERLNTKIIYLSLIHI